MGFLRERKNLMLADNNRKPKPKSINLKLVTGDPEPTIRLAGFTPSDEIT